MEGRDRQLVAQYLEGCPMFIAWMEYSSDMIESRFEMAGGSGVVSDGTFYWRADAVEYVRHYGIRIADEALSLFASREWRAPELTKAEYDAVYLELETRFTDPFGEIVTFSP